MVTDREFAIIGAGAVGRSLAAALGARGAHVAAVASRRIESAREAAQLARCRFATTDAAEAARRANAVALCVPDDAIAAVCQAAADGGGVKPGDVVLHFSGALPSRTIAAAQAAGASVLSFHPVQTFARPDADAFRGIVCVLEGDEAGVAFGTELATFLGASPIAIRAEDKALYHAALCIACNYLVTLADAGAGLLAQAGLGQPTLPALLPLLRGAVDNLARVGLPDALTGPICRGDLATLRAHLAALARQAPALLPLYRTVGLQTVALAVRKGGIAEEQARALRNLLGEAAPDGAPPTA
ncbi:MAG TPA: DUF2520 domain-containing protein [Planctomycetota bacterium]|nr:DUF2520 domain-containing protein [Planctomycetota bacterium]